MKSCVVKRSVKLGRHLTSVSLEDAFWNSLREIARSRQMTVTALLASVDAGRQYGNFSSAIRLFVLDYYRNLTRASVGDASESSQCDTSASSPETAPWLPRARAD